MLRHDSIHCFDISLDRRREGGHEVRVHDDAVAFVAQLRDRASLRSRIEKRFGNGNSDRQFKHLLRGKLFLYQRRGAVFLARAGRSLLADDMGLGKTIQSLAAAEMLAQVGEVQRVLIVTLTSIKHQWKQEIERFTNRSAQVIEGMTAARRSAYREDSFFKITNYPVLHRDVEAIEQWAPDLIILDEAQRIKNWKTRTAQTVKVLPSQHAIVLTGTPLENRMEELHSIVEFVDRYRLGPMFRFMHEHQQSDEAGKLVGYTKLGEITRTLEPILLRRTKSQVLAELPERLEKYLLLPMTPQQMAYHEENRELVALIVAKWRRFRRLTDADQKRLQMALQNMRMSCNSTYLLDQDTEFGCKPDEVVNNLMELLEDRDAKVVVFSQWIRSHELLQRRLQDRKCEHVMFHGSVPGPKRKDLIERFRNEAKCRVFLSTDAGGVGLNLQNASAVLNMDQPWNPAVIEQRIGRVHRMGQSRPVNVVHFVSEGTIEHGMLDVLRFKKSLFAGVLDGGEDSVFLGGTRLKKFMDSVEQATGSVPAAPPASEASTSELIDNAEPPTDAPAVDGDPEHADPSRPGVDLMSQIVELGQALIGGFSQAASAMQSPQAGGPKSSPSHAWSVERDDRTGTPMLKLPMPSPETMAKAADLLQAILGAMKPPTR